MNFKNLIPGGRIVKTALAVLICLILAYIIDYDYPIYAVIAGVLMMKESSDETKWAGFNRMKGTVLGGVISYITLMIFGKWLDTIWGPFIMSFSVIVVLSITKWMDQDSYVGSMSSVVLLITLMGHASTSRGAFVYVVIRTVETLVGILIAFFVNEYIKRLQ